MPAVTVDLDLETYERLAKRAADANTSLSEFMGRLARAEAASVDVSPDVARITADVVERYRPVLRRLGE
jgi:hypothetical protein